MDTDATKKEAEIARIETAKLVDQIKKVTIRKDADLHDAAEFLARIKKTAKNIKAKKEAITKPLNAALKEVRDQYKPAEDSLANAEKLIKEAMLKYQQMVEERAAKQTAKIEEKVDAGEMDFGSAMEKVETVKQAPTSVKTDSGSSFSFGQGARKIRINDPSALPVSYFMRPRVLEALRLEVSEDVLKKDQPCPPGAEVYREKQVSGRI